MESAKKFKNKTVMITGGLGFIGSNVAHALADYAEKILIVDALIPNYGGNKFNIDDIKDKVEVNLVDIRESSRMNELVKNQDYIFNLAGQVSHLDSMTDPHTDLDINCKSQLTILEACKKNNPDTKIVFAGTRGQYGKPDYLPVDEKHPMHPTDVNGINKIAGEWYHILYNNVYGIRASSLRLTNTFGPRQMMKNNRQTFLAWFIRLAIDNELIKIYGDGSQLRDFNYVDDVVNAFLLAASNKKADGQVFNLGSGKPISLKDVTEKVIEIAGSGKIEYSDWPDAKKKIEIGDYYADYSKINSMLGWEPKVSLENGLKTTIDFFMKNKKLYW